jgi:hypothetical protein
LEEMQGEKEKEGKKEEEEGGREEWERKEGRA